jgi:hypothetical protein
MDIALETLNQNLEFGDLFECIQALLYVLSIKTELGVKTRRLYIEGNKDSLGLLADNEYEELISKLETFYKAFRAVWLKDNKPHGFEVQDARIGGLIMRARHCQERIVQYVHGELESIPELDEKIVDYLKGVT